jgi:PKHD-type hydroxylase
MLLAIEGVLDRGELERFRSGLDAATEWQDGASSAGSLARTVKRNQQLDDRCELARTLGNRILQKLDGHPLFVSAALPRRVYPPKFNRYAEGGTYGAHVDGALLQVPGTNATLRSDLSATLFLSEPDEYEGGELQVEGPFGVQAVKLPAGDMVLYPSSSLHRVTPVVRGARLASFFWIESHVASDADRALLFDLDRTIQALTPQLGAGDRSLVGLTGIYHNLLRRWTLA